MKMLTQLTPLDFENLLEIRVAVRRRQGSWSGHPTTRMAASSASASPEEVIGW
jgi:hypothetical protein